MKYRHKKMGLVIQNTRKVWIKGRLRIRGTVYDPGTSHFVIGAPFGDWAENWVQCQ